MRLNGQDVGKICQVSKESEARKCFCFYCKVKGYLATPTSGLAGLCTVIGEGGSLSFMCCKELFQTLQIDHYFCRKYINHFISLDTKLKSLLFMGECLFRLVRKRRKKESTGDIFSETQF